MAAVADLERINAQLEKVEGQIDRLEQRIIDIDHELKASSISEPERLRLYDKQNKLQDEKMFLLNEKMFLLKKLERCMFLLVCFNTVASLAHSCCLLGFLFSALFVFVPGGRPVELLQKNAGGNGASPMEADTEVMASKRKTVETDDVAQGMLPSGCVLVYAKVPPFTGNAKKLKTFVETKVSDEAISMDIDGSDSKDDGFILRSLPGGWLLPNSKEKTLLRRSALPLMDDIKSYLRRKLDVLLVGSAGTGKSLLMMVICKEFIDEGKTVVLDVEDGNFCLVKNGVPQRGIRGESFHVELSNADTVYFYDHTLKSPRTENLFVEATTFATASPSRSQTFRSGTFKATKNERPFTKLYHPAWTLDEILLLRRHDKQYEDIPESTVTRLFDYWGGNVRAVLLMPLHYRDAAPPSMDPKDPRVWSIVEATSLQALHESLDGCDPKLMVEYIGSRQALSDKLDRISHTLFSLIPRNDFRAFSYSFCSAYVRDTVLSKMTSSVKVFVSLFMSSCCSRLSWLAFLV